MVSAAEAERSRSINPGSVTPFADSQADIKVLSCKLVFPDSFLPLSVLGGGGGLFKRS